MEAKPLEVLRQLLLRPGEVVTKEELLESVWPGLMVVDGSLATAVSKLRKGLGDDDQIVRTVPRMGYRLAVPVKSRTMATPAAEPELQPTAPVPGREQGPLTGRSWMLVAGVALLIVLATGLGLYRRASLPKPSTGTSRITSLAVLPLANMSGDPAQDYFADGMTEELITDLSKIRALKVISRTSVMQYKGAKKPLPQIAREFERVPTRAQPEPRLCRRSLPVWFLLVCDWKARRGDRGKPPSFGA